MSIYNTGYGMSSNMQDACPMCRHIQCVTDQADRHGLPVQCRVIQEVEAAL
jgi:hypothetical protein